MSAVLATFQRELRAYFLSPMAYVLMFFFLVLNGVTFSVIVSYLTDPAAPPGRPFDYFFNGFLFWLVLLFVVPVITMRLLAEERRSGSIEVLMTAPVSEAQVVAGKYLAALTFYVALWAPTLLYAVLVDRWSDVDWGILAAGYLGIFLLGAFLLAVGIFASAMVRSQIVAAMIAFSLMLLLFLLGFLSGLVHTPWMQQVLGYVSVLDHMDEMARGIVDTRRLVFYVTGTLFFLFAASRALEDRKWR
jgi:ABC-2 type transport system permease protein